MPLFAEGYGLPLAEANAAGVRVVVSDIPVFREIAEGSFVSLSPIDGIGWLRAIEDFSSDFRAAAQAKPHLWTNPTISSRDRGLYQGI